MSKLDGVDTTTIGHSVLGRPIKAFHVGDYGENQIIISGAIHAREWITALVVAELLRQSAGGCFFDLLETQPSQVCTSNIRTRKSKKQPPALFATPLRGGIYFIPLCNPGGVEIALTMHPLLKANARMVDLNVNFDADWGGGAQNVRVAGSENFIGEYPHSEPEVIALADFTKKIKPSATVAYHSKGEVIYWGFESSRESSLITSQLLARTKRLAKLVGCVTGYKPIKTKNSTGGYSDWVSMRLGVPALTIEVGNDDYEHPIGVDKLPEILEQNREVPNVVLNFLNKSIKLS